MYMVAVTLVAGALALPDNLEDAIVTDILWTVAVSKDGLEHIHSRTASDRIELTMFHRAAAAADAIAAAERICLQALSSSPSLHGWKLARS